MDTPVKDPARAVLDIVQGLVAELHAARRGAPITLDSTLVHDLGLDSLARVELLLRIGQAFHVSLSEQVMISAETPRDLLRAALAASPAAPGSVIRSAPPPSPAAEGLEAVPLHASTLLEVLEWHVQQHPERTHIVICGEAGEQTLSYQALYAGASAVAAGLQQRELLQGQRVAIMLPAGSEYFFSFYGVLLAGGVPVPIYPPAQMSQLEDHLRRHAGILANAQAVMLITLAEALPLAHLLQAQLQELRTVSTVPVLATAAAQFSRTAVQAQDIALLQYTSGSTGNPKGVVLTHANLLANIRAMGQAVEADSSDVFVSWLPLYHDMGLIGAWLSSLYFSMRLVVMSPLAFLLRPESWLWAIHRHGGTLSAAPNFAYELCLRRIEASALEGLDLRSWRMAFNGAEPVSPETVLRFAEHFARYGLRREAIAPVYGLAECAVGLAFPPPGRGPLIDRIRREELARSGHAIAAAQDEHDALRFVACGQPLPGHQVRVVDAAGHEAGEREEGRLEFCGPSATSGYFRNPEQTRKLFHSGAQGSTAWLDTGDLAYMAGGDIYLTARLKDIIIRAGRNIYPHEIEEAVGDIPGIRAGCVAVFASHDPNSGTERMVVLAESRETAHTELDKLRTLINRQVVALLGEPPDDVVLAPPHTVLKTSSGKIRRAASRELYERGALATAQRALWWQVVRLAWAGVLPGLRRGARAAAALLYATYAWGLFLLFAPLTWLLVSMLPRPAWCWSASRVLARLFVRCAGTPLAVHGLENLPPDSPCVLVVNHASYLDGIVLAAALPRPYVFAAKNELKQQLVPRVYLQRMGAEFVERFAFEQSVADVKRLLQSLRSGQSLVFFPEGTFQRMPGVMPFHMGAFVLAAQAGVPVIPVAIRGTRSILRAEQWLPRRGAISFSVAAPIIPQGDDWAASLQLRDAARGEILSLSGEPDLHNLQ